MAAVAVPGEVQLLVDEMGLEASLRFTPDPAGGASWTADSVARVLAEARVPVPSASALDGIMQAFARARAPVVVSAAKGLPPLPGTDEEAEWADPGTPPEFAAFEDRAVREAGPPALFRVRVERVARERIVKKPGAFPFLPAREEKVIEYEKVEIKEPIPADPRVLRSFWAPADALVGHIVAPRPGKPGKSIYGKPISPPHDDDPSFQFGRGLSRAKGEIHAETAGFVRVGKRWADLVPFSPHRLNVRRSEDGATFLMDFTPGARELPPPDPAAALEEAVAAGASPDTLVPPETVSAALSRAIQARKPLEGLSLSLDRDAEVSVQVSEDGLMATLSIAKGRGKGIPLALSMVSSALAARNLKGIKGDKLKADVLAFYKGPETELRDYILVEGRAPARGKDRSFGFRPSFMEVDEAKATLAALQAHPALAAKVPSLGEFPLSAVELVAVVKKGQELARFSAPVPGQAGVDVYGNALPGLPGADPAVRVYENVVMDGEAFMSGEDGLLLASSSAEAGTGIRVVPWRDARIEVTVAKDAMSASVSLGREYGLGRGLGMDSVQAALAGAGVRFGIDPKAIETALAYARDGMTVADHVVARGRPAVIAGGWKINWIVRLASGSTFTLRTDGSADFKNRDTATLVKEGDAILEMSRIGVEGQDGSDVLGQALKAPRDPRVAEPPTWDASIREERRENGDVVLKAARSGDLKFDKNRLSVDSAQKINGDIGPATGNVRFPGPVAVGGSVLAGFAIVAGGDLGVAGSIEAALASADGSIKIGEGIKGARKGTVRAKGTIEAGFAEQAMLLAVEGITLKNSALLCNLKTNGKLTLQGDKGHLVGGVCRARKGIEVQNLGSETGSRTEVSFGQDYLIKDAIEAEEREIERVKLLVLQADREMQDTEGRHGDLAEVRQRKLKLVKLLEKRGLRLFELREKFEEHFPGEIAVRGTVFPGTVLESHARTLEIKAKKTRVAFYFDLQAGRIAERPLK